MPHFSYYAEEAALNVKINTKDFKLQFAWL